MAEVIDMIMRDIEDDISINAHGIQVELKSEGFLKRRKFIRLFGTTDSEVEKEKAQRIAEHHAGDQYRVLNELSVKKD